MDPADRLASPPRTAARKAHLPALDGLRGVAILGVLLFHTGHLPGGFLGVDLFFALSGYLITDLLLREAGATGTVSLAAFWGRRVRRLLPALALVLAVVTVVVRLAGEPDLVRTTLADGPWVQANLVNWHLLAESASYWDRFGPGRVFEHLWSIAVEEQFYLVWPVLVLLIARSGRRVHARVALAAVVISVASVVLMAVLADPADPTRVYTGTDTRAFSLLLGALAATAPVRKALSRLPGAVQLLPAAAVAVVWALADGMHSQWLFTGGLFAYSLTASALIGLCAAAPHGRVATVLAWKPLRWLGSVSYSLYLWHWPVIVLLSPERTLLVFAVSITLAALSKYLVEDPVRFRARWARGRRGVYAFTGVMLSLAILWLAVPAPPPPVVDLTGLT
ncbi:MULTISPECIES: acyltransferase family protein [Amycolatopsis]|uniref:Acyltransferase n=1 Tax=Amycolatopsis dongchuanensis TaxID=1070866 RepID=A0ABP8VKC0_9PSEU